MSNAINTINDRSFTINGKLIEKDMEGNWVKKTELTPSEEKAASNWIRVLNEEEYKKHEHLT